MIDHSLPLWAGEGWDSAAGGFVERLDSEGRADYQAPRRVRVQARQIYCFAKAAQMGWYPQGRDIAIKGMDYLLTKARSPDGRPGFVHVLSPDGSTIDPARDTYDHAFVLLALATLYQLTNDAQLLQEIASLLGFLDRDLRSPHGGYVEGIPATMPRRQNPQMHLFEAMIATFDATRDQVYQSRAGDLFGLFVANLYDPRRQVLGEYFEDDWSRIEPVCVEPGHQAEWVWLLKGFERITGCPTGRHRAGLLASALRYCDDVTGCLFDEGNADGSIRSQRHGSRRPRPESRGRPVKRAKRLPGCIGTICVILSGAAGTISSIATIDRWSLPYRPLPFTMFSARLRKRSALSVSKCQDRADVDGILNDRADGNFHGSVTRPSQSHRIRKRIPVRLEATQPNQSPERNEFHVGAVALVGDLDAICRGGRACNPENDRRRPGFQYRLAYLMNSEIAATKNTHSVKLMATAKIQGQGDESRRP
jgi:N-acylglucosamine 2-epimerase (GlcNAc 2-epimerase)